jgi:glycerophosphoryl diester phosphodiesterase
VQSFWPTNLDVVELRMPRVATSLLTLPQLNLGGPAFTALRGYEWDSPSYGSDFALVSKLAHALGRRVVPWTLDNAADVKGAAAAGADAIITDDPPMAAALG